jgi:DNA modification methylase
VLCSYSQLVPIADLKPHPKNPNTHSAEQIALLAKIVQSQGWRSPIVVSKRSGFIIAGHGRLLAAKQLGLEAVPVDFQNFKTDSDELAHLLADNRIAELSELDDAILSGLLTELQTEGFDLDLTGFTGDDLSALLPAAAAIEAEPDIDRAGELQKEWSTAPGQLWQLGDHRLLCGDCGKLDHVKALLEKHEHAETLVTSPPYWTGQSYDAKQPETEIEKQINAWAQVFAQVVRRRIQIQTGHTNSTIAGDKGPMRKILLDAMWATAFKRQGWLLRHRRVWAKGGGLLCCSPVGDLIDESWEVILTFWPGENRGGQERTSEGWAQKGVWDDLAGVGKNITADHPCPFPVELAERMVALYSKREDVIFEPFCGSGTTIIACERLGRKCLALELSPAYVAVTLDRFKKATGKTPVLITK